MNRDVLHKLAPLASLVLFAVALGILHHELRNYHYREVAQTLRALPPDRVLFAFLLTLFGYAAMTGYDALAFRYIGEPLAYSRIALASFIGYAFSNNMGHSILTGSSVRFRLYSASGISPVQIARVVAFCILTIWLGLLTVGGLVFLLEPFAVPSLLHLPITSVRPLGALLLSIVVAYLLLSTVRKAPFRIRDWELALPGPGLSLKQILVSSLDWALAGAVLYVLLPPGTTLSYPAFLALFILAQLAAMLSQVPGGLGVFETVMLLLLAPHLQGSQALGSLVAYRVIYYLIPLGLAAVILGGYEILERRAGARRVARLVGVWTPRLVPNVLAITMLLAGAILLFSGATPAAHSRLAWLEDFLPLPIVELSHFLGSLAGIGLLLLAQGISRRLDAAYHASVILLSAGIVFSLLKGADYEEAILLSIMLGALLPCRRHFYRKASLTSERFTPTWIAAIALVLLSSVWLGFFSFKHVNYSHDLWWRFAIADDAPRFLRATVGAVGAVLAVAVWRLLRPAPPDPLHPPPGELDRVAAVVARSGGTTPALALLGDKSFLWSESGNAFIMYGVRGRTFVAMGDPVGPEEEWAELAWRFREMADRHDGWTVFYEVRTANLPLYLDLGLTLLKLGEEARVPLEKFSLEGGMRKGMRHLRRHVEKEGCGVEIVPTADVPALLPELRRISDAWLADKNTREKGFSLGSFEPDYLVRFPHAIVRREGRIIAFANLWLGANYNEMSPDLMRYADAPPNVMEYLLIELMLWGKQAGYRWFDLGMAPLSGFESRALAPLWSRLGSLLFRHGEQFYNFQGLRQYKEKFDPIWEPRYLACPGGLALPRIIANVAALISGGFKGVVAK